jgi:hypothetical protein
VCEIASDFEVSEGAEPATRVLDPTAVADGEAEVLFKGGKDTL